MRLRVFKPRLWLAAVVLCALAAVNGFPSHQAGGEAKSEAKSEGKSEGKSEAKSEAKGEEKKGEGAAGKEGEGAAPAAPAFKLGPPLGGYFDRTALRSLARVQQYRYLLKDVTQMFNTEKAWGIRFSCAIEFGSESGVAELENEQNAALNDLRSVVSSFKFEELLSVAGKIRLKEEIAKALNRRLATARVRQVYLTDFLMGPGYLFGH